GSRFRSGALVTEDAEIITELHTLRGSEVYINRVILAHGLSPVLRGHNHRHRLPADRRKNIELACVLKRANRTRLIGKDYVAALHRHASKHDLCHRGLRLHFDNSQLPKIDVGIAHGFRQLRLPFEPGNFAGVAFHSEHTVKIAFFNALIHAAVDVDVIATVESLAGHRFFAGSDVGVAADPLFREET